MKYTKIITSLFVAAAFLFSSSADAAEKKGKGKGNNPFAELGLSKEQMKEVAALRKEVGAEQKKAREAKDKDAMKAAAQKMNDGLAKILSEEQMEKYKKAQAAARKGGKKGAPKKGKKKKDS